MIRQRVPFVKWLRPSDSSTRLKPMVEAPSQIPASGGCSRNHEHRPFAGWWFGVRRLLRICLFVGGIFSSLSIGAAEILFQEDFNGRIDADWTWIREHREAWRIRESGLEVRIEPGNMWGAANDAKNLLVRDLPKNAVRGIEVSVSVQNQPTEQYEQVDLVWYYDDSHMVKLGQELVDGQLSIVMGREERDRTRTIAIIPLKSNHVRLRLTVHGDRIQGHFQIPGTDRWVRAGECDLPSGGTARVCLQFYQGSAEKEHWARVTEFRIRDGVQIDDKGP